MSYTIHWTRDEPDPTNIFASRGDVIKYIQDRFKCNTIETRFGFLTEGLEDNFAFQPLPTH